MEAIATADNRRRRTEEDAGPTKARRVKDPDTRALENALQDVLGLAVSIEHKGQGGELRIRYKNLEQLDGLCRRLNPATCSGIRRSTPRNAGKVEEEFGRDRVVEIRQFPRFEDTRVGWRGSPSRDWLRSNAERLFLHRRLAAKMKAAPAFHRAIERPARLNFEPRREKRQGMP